MTIPIYMTKKSKPPSRVAQNQYQSNEEKVYGVRLCETVFEKRCDDIKKIYIDKSLLTQMKSLIAWAVKERRAYKIVTADELAKIAQSVHHEGLILVVQQKKSVSVDLLFKQMLKRDSATLFYLNGVSNPHNLGHILRTSAHFGATDILVDRECFVSVPPSGQRVSEGGSEWVNLISISDPPQVLQMFAEAGFSIIGTSSHATRSLSDLKSLRKKMVVLGEESRGISKPVMKRCEFTVKIDGTERVESLNVASAHAILSYACYNG